MSETEKTKLALQYLERDRVFHIGMIEPVRRGTAELLYAENDGVFLLEKKSDAYMISVDGPDLAERLIAGIRDAKVFAVHQDFCIPLIEKRFGLPLQFQCFPAAYLKKDLLPLHDGIKIETLNDSHFSMVVEHYHTMDDPDYIRKLIDQEQLFGAFVNGGFAGFIGIHLEGSIGMLEVLPEFRRQGLGTALESYLVNLMVTKGWTPFCEVFADNINSMNMQRKLGFELSERYLSWFF